MPVAYHRLGASARRAERHVCLERRQLGAGPAFPTGATSWSRCHGRPRSSSTGHARHRRSTGRSALAATPALFSPNGDGRRRPSAIAFTLDAGGAVRVRVLRRVGPVATLVDAAAPPGGHTLAWNGRRHGRSPTARYALSSTRRPRSARARSALVRSTRARRVCAHPRGRRPRRHPRPLPPRRGGAASCFGSGGGRRARRPASAGRAQSSRAAVSRTRPDRRRTRPGTEPRVVAQRQPRAQRT